VTKQPDGQQPGLNPKLRASQDATYDISSTDAPLKSISVKKPEGEFWPLMWASVFILGVAISIYLIFF